MQSKYVSSICFQQFMLSIMDAGSTSELISSSLKLTSSISQFNCITNALSSQAQSASSSAPKKLKQTSSISQFNCITIALSSQAQSASSSAPRKTSKLVKSANSIASLMFFCCKHVCDPYTYSADVISAANPKCKPSLYMVCFYVGALIITNARYKLP